MVFNIFGQQALFFIFCIVDNVDIYILFWI
jgi:hypothetical protein